MKKLYKCEICGAVVEALHESPGGYICCNQPMKLLEEKTADEGMEKHVPVVEIKGNNVTVKVGSNPHPMEEGHYICLIQLMRGGKVVEGRRLYPGDKPEASFCIDNTEGITARELCNVHGLWKN